MAEDQPENMADSADTDADPTEDQPEDLAESAGTDADLTDQHNVEDGEVADTSEPTKSPASAVADVPRGGRGRAKLAGLIAGTILAIAAIAAGAVIATLSIVDDDDDAGYELPLPDPSMSDDDFRLPDDDPYGRYPDEGSDLDNDDGEWFGPDSPADWREMLERLRERIKKWRAEQGEKRFGDGERRFGDGERRFGDGERRFGDGERRFGDGERRFGDGERRFGDGWGFWGWPGDRGDLYSAPPLDGWGDFGIPEGFSFQFGDCEPEGLQDDPDNAGVESFDFPGSGLEEIPGSLEEILRLFGIDDPLEVLSLLGFDNPEAIARYFGLDDSGVLEPPDGSTELDEPEESEKPDDSGDSDDGDDSDDGGDSNSADNA